jgi:hypothetical protein
MAASIQLTGLATGLLLPALPGGVAQPAFVLDPNSKPTITAPGGEIQFVVLQSDGRLIVFG